MLKLIWAEDQNGIIGNGNELPWHIKSDLQYFKEQTTGHTVVMGRKTFESLGEKPLPNRVNYVLTTNEDLIYAEPQYEYLFFTSRFKAIIEKAKNEDVFVIGGRKVYDLFMPFADELYRTVILKSYKGDTKAPTFNKREWYKYDTTEVKKAKEPKLIFEKYRKLDLF